MGRHFRIAGLLLLTAVHVYPEPAQIAPGVWLQRGSFTSGSQPDGNSVIFEGSKGLVIVDTGRHEHHTRKILDFAASRKKVAAVINTHWHLDHIGGNLRVRAQYPKVRVYATGALEGALAGFLARYRAQLIEVIPNTSDPAQQAGYRNELALIDSGTELAPDEVIGRSGPKTMAGRRLELFVTDRAATEADLWLIDRKSGVLVAGDLITLPAPFLDTACPAGMKSALDHLASQKFDLVVPGHGAPMSRESFERYRSSFGKLLECAGSEASTESCTTAWITGLGDLASPSDEEFTRGLMGYYIDNHLRGDPAQTARLCGS